MHFRKLIVALLLLAGAPAVMCQPELDRSLTPVGQSGPFEAPALPSMGYSGPVVISPDGTKVAFHFAPTSSRKVVYVEDLATLRLRKLSAPWTIGDFSWFPRGDALAATLIQGSIDHPPIILSVWKLNVNDGSSERLVMLKDEGCIFPLVSPDDKEILFLALDRGDLALFDLSTHEVRFLTHSGDVKRYAYAWDNTGKVIYFVTGPRYPTHSYDGSISGSIWAINADGTGKKLITTVALPTSIRISTDGAWLAYASCNADVTYSIFLTSLRDVAPIRITEKGGGSGISWAIHRNAFVFPTFLQEVAVFSAGEPVSEDNPRRLDIKAGYALWAKKDSVLVVPDGEGLRLYDLESRQSKRILSKDDIEK